MSDQVEKKKALVVYSHFQIIFCFGLNFKIIILLTNVYISKRASKFYSIASLSVVILHGAVSKVKGANFIGLMSNYHF